MDEAAKRRAKLIKESEARRKEAEDGLKVVLVELKCHSSRSGSCRQDGAVFYMRGSRVGAGHLASRCPVCGSSTIRATGRVFPTLEDDVVYVVVTTSKDEPHTPLIHVERERAAAEKIKASAIASGNAVDGDTGESVDDPPGFTSIETHRVGGRPE